MKKGDTVWEISERVFVEKPIDIRYAVTKETFDGWFSFDPKRESAILKCDYDGGFEVLTANLFPTEKEAKKEVAPKVLKSIKKRVHLLKKELKEFDKQTKKWQILADE